MTASGDQLFYKSVDPNADPQLSGTANPTQITPHELVVMTPGDQPFYKSVDPNTDPQLAQAADATYVTPHGVVEYGRVDAAGNFLQAKVAGDQVLYGNATNDGGWISQDGTLYLDKNNVPTQGITDPAGQFLAGGSTKLIGGQTLYGSGTSDGGWISEDGSKFVTPGGVLESGKLDAGGNFLEAKVVGSQVLYGSGTKDGGWISQDGTLYLDKNNVPTHGITDPGGQFLADGSAKLIGGQTLYGSGTSDGGWLSEDGSKFVTPDGVLESGKLDAGGNFLVQRTVGSQVLYGNPTTDGGWISQDGTLYLDKYNVPTQGITDPGTKQFLADGSTKLIDGQTQYGSGTKDGGWISEKGDIYVTSAGVIQYGMLDPSGNFLERKTFGNNVMYGNPTDDGGWISQDGTIYVDKNNVVTLGITDPGTKQFLADGSTKLFDGQTVYGSGTKGGGWISEKGDIFVTSAGVIQYGMLDPNGYFLERKTFGNNVMYGNPTDDGGWISQDGTIYIDKNNVVTLGITDPGTKQFLPNGIAKVFNGQTYYGYMVGNDFITGDGTRVILANGTVLTGTLDTNTQIFTAANGALYAITSAGIESATLQTGDGSYLLGDGSVLMTAHSWSVDLPLFADAMKLVQSKANSISDSCMTINWELSNIEDNWVSPAGDGFKEIAGTINDDLRQLNIALSGVIGHMQASYTQYVQTEQAAVKNMSH